MSAHWLTAGSRECPTCGREWRLTVDPIGEPALVPDGVDPFSACGQCGVEVCVSCERLCRSCLRPLCRRCRIEVECGYECRDCNDLAGGEVAPAGPGDVLVDSGEAAVASLGCPVGCVDSLLDATSSINQPGTPEPPCTCTRVDVDYYDVRGCEACDPDLQRADL